LVLSCIFANIIQMEAILKRYDKSLIAIAISKTMTCDLCPYPCKIKENSSPYNCEIHWKKILDLIGYNVEKNNDIQN